MLDLLYPFTTMTFQAPLFLLVGPALAAVVLLRRQHSTSLSVPSLAIPRKGRTGWRARLRRPVLRYLAAFAIVSLSIAAARPQRLLHAAAVEDSRNLMLAIDVSPSMGSADFSSGFTRLTRLGGVRRVVKNFIETRARDRIGLVVFGGTAVLQAPLTGDHQLLNELVDQLEVGMAGEGTAIGDGLGVAIKRVRQFGGDSRSIILLTDGVNNSGQVNPLKAAQVARDYRIKIHTIGVGGVSTETLRSERGVLSERSLRSIEYDEQTLKGIAEKTGGVYFNAEDLSGLAKVYAEIDKLERSSGPSTRKPVAEEQFFPFLAFGFCFYSLYLLTANYLFFKVP